MALPELTCPECGAPLPAPEGGAAAPEAPCPGCGRRLLAFRFPALTRRQANDAAGKAACPGEAACFHHADKQAEAFCETCGRFLCALCRIDFNRRTLCPACLSLTQTADAAAHTPRRLRYDILALLCIALSPFVYCLSFANAGVTLYLCLRYWKTPLSVLPRSRWRFVVSGLMALLVLSLWLGLGGYAVLRLATRSAQPDEPDEPAATEEAAAPEEAP